MSEVERVELESVPVHACDPVVQALRVIYDDIARMSQANEAAPDDIELHAAAANTIAKSCEQLCVNGCVRELHFRMESAGLILPESQERELLFDLVSDTLASEILEGNTLESTPYEEIEIPDATADELKEIVQRRLGIFDDPELLQRIADKQKVTIEEVEAAIKETMTPIHEDVYAELAQLVRGNIRAALAIMAYFQGVFPTFRATDHESLVDSAFIRSKGFRPGTPWQITPIDVLTLRSMVDEVGGLELPQNRYSAMWIRLTDNPDDIEIFTKNYSQVIDVVDETQVNLPVKYIDVNSHVLES